MILTGPLTGLNRRQGGRARSTDQLDLTWAEESSLGGRAAGSDLGLGLGSSWMELVGRRRPGVQDDGTAAQAGEAERQGRAGQDRTERADHPGSPSGQVRCQTPDGQGTSSPGGDGGGPAAEGSGEGGAGPGAARQGLASLGLLGASSWVRCLPSCAFSGTPPGGPWTGTVAWSETPRGVRPVAAVAVPESRWAGGAARRCHRGGFRGPESCRRVLVLLLPRARNRAISHCAHEADRDRSHFESSGHLTLAEMLDYGNTIVTVESALSCGTNCCCMSRAGAGASSRSNPPVSGR